jgi:hypothetical protein
MRMHIAALGVGLALAVAPSVGWAAPAAPLAEPSHPLAVMPVAGGCGPYAAPRSWYDAYGRLRTECVAIAPVAAPGCGWGWHWATWRDGWGRLHSRCVPN